MQQRFCLLCSRICTFDCRAAVVGVASAVLVSLIHRFVLVLGCVNFRVRQRYVKLGANGDNIMWGSSASSKLKVLSVRRRGYVCGRG